MKINNIRKVLNSKSLEQKLQFLKQIVLQIIDAGDVEFLHQILTSFDFMIAKMENKDPKLGVLSLLSDFEATIQAGFDTEDKIFSALKKSVELSADTIEKDVSQAYAQIYARLPINNNPNFLNLLNSYSPNHTWLRIISDTLRTGTDSLARILGEGHTGLIDGCALSDDATTALSASRDKTLRVWDLTTGLCEHVLNGHTDRVNSCSLSGDGLFALSASDDGTLRFWNVKIGSCLHVFDEHTDKVTDCALSKNGKIAISSSKDGTAKVWDTSTGKCTLTFEEHTDYVTCCSLSSDGQKALSGSCDHTLRLWNTQTGECFSVVENEASVFLDCALSGNGRFAVSVSDALWLEQDSDSNEMFVKPLKNNPDDEFLENEVDISAFPAEVKEDFWHTLEHLLGELNVSLSDLDENHLLRLWDFEVGECIHTFEEPDDFLLKCALSEDAKIALSATAHGKLRVWDLTTSECLSVLKNSSLWISSCSLDRRGNFALSASQNLDLRLWNLRRILDTSSINLSEKKAQIIAECKYGRQGNVAISVSPDDVIKFWNSKNGKCLGKIEMEESNWTHHCSISLESKLLLVFSTRNLTGKIPVVDLLTGQTIRHLVGHTSPVFHGEISKDGNVGFSGASDQTLRVWDVPSGQCLHIIDINESDIGEISSCALSADGRIALAGFTTGILKVWSTQDGSCLQTLTEHSGKIACCSISETGHRFLSSSDDNLLLLWDLNSGRCLQKIPLDSDVLHHATFSSNGQLLLYASTRQTVQVVCTDTAEILASFSFDSWISSLAFSPTALEIMIGDYSGCVHFMSIEGLEG